MDIVLQFLGFGLTLVILTILWTKVARQKELRGFWLCLALAWTMNLCATIAWGIHDLSTGTELNELSLVDAFFGMRYLLFGLALWLYPIKMPLRTVAWVAIAMLLVGIIVWKIYYHPIVDTYPGATINFLGYLMYPVFDAGLLTVAVLRYLQSRQLEMGKILLLLLLAATSYGLGNAINMYETTFTPIAGGILQSLLWPLTDVLALTATLIPLNVRQTTS
jgi:hypothetical protein